ncbi:hypothetical protein L1049_019965 [Liquidambar formosana]|uniref:Uncharacterized protein n=1 Tax=Liquidambar formosana TaxID=63359 RepID=A0AAP0X6Y4_LIQFO
MKTMVRHAGLVYRRIILKHTSFYSSLHSKISNPCKKEKGESEKYVFFRCLVKTGGNCLLRLRARKSLRIALNLLTLFSRKIRTISWKIYQLEVTFDISRIKAPLVSVENDHEKNVLLLIDEAASH